MSPDGTPRTAAGTPLAGTPAIPAPTNMTRGYEPFSVTHTHKLSLSHTDTHTRSLSLSLSLSGTTVGS